MIEAAGNTYDSADPNHPAHGRTDGYMRAWPVADPLRTVHTTASKALVVPVEGRDGKQARSVEETLRTMTTRNETGLVVSCGGTWRDSAAPATHPLSTRTTRETDGIAMAPFLTQFRDRVRDLNPVTDPVGTVVADGANYGLVEQPAFITELRGGGSTTPTGQRPTRHRHRLFARTAPSTDAESGLLPSVASHVFTVFGAKIPTPTWIVGQTSSSSGMQTTSLNLKSNITWTQRSR